MIELSTRRFVLLVSAVIAAMFAVHLTLQLLLTLQLVPAGLSGLASVAAVMNVDQERNLPTYVASGLLTLCAVLALGLSRMQRLPFPGWLALAVVFAAAGIDEYMGFHERLNLLMADLVDQSGWLRFPWVIPGAVLALVLGLGFLRSVMTLRRETRNGLMFGAGLFLFGALGIEVLGARAWDLQGRDSIQYLLFSTTEEAFEFAGVLVWLRTLFGHSHTLETRPTLRLVRDAPAS